MFYIKPRSDVDIQGGKIPRYWYFELLLDDRIVFSTENLEPLFSVRDLANNGSISLDADRNSLELGEFCQMKLTRQIDKLLLEVKPRSRMNLETAGTTTVDEMWGALSEALQTIDETNLEDIH